ncbi:MAG: sigma-70 family RNA polymerase sigma factor [Lachnospiraceae bacterium]|nr:sigma-70 family RNA polymerase sigma factor [Lachnospiraceae bacterium]
MDRKKVIEILEFYKEIDGEISLYRQILHDYESQYYDTVGAMVNDGQPKGQYHISRPVESAALNIPESLRGDMEKYEEKVCVLQEAKSQILQEISRLNLKEKTIIFDYYIHGMKWEQVAERNHYSDRQCKNIRNAAVVKLVVKFQSNAFLREFRKDG